MAARLVHENVESVAAMRPGINVNAIAIPWTLSNTGSAPYLRWSGTITLRAIP
jgi:hypothetical protein